LFLFLCLSGVYSFPIGINLSPLGGNYQGLNQNPVATYVFRDLFKHCPGFYIRSVCHLNCFFCFVFVFVFV
jgi:hypothetical protein